MVHLQCSNQRKFLLPKNTIVQSKKKIILSPKITGFSVLDKNTLKLLNPQGEIIYNYSSPVEPIKVITKKPISKKTYTTENILGNNTETLVDNMTAEAIKSDTIKKDNFKYGVFGLLAFLGISTSAVYFIRSRNRKYISKTNVNDFEIIDE